MMQPLAVMLILSIAAGYAGWRIRQLWTEKRNPCHGCDGCTLKKQVCDKKREEKFGQSK